MAGFVTTEQLHVAASAVAVFLAGGIVIALSTAGRRLQGTTLVAPWLWAILAVLLAAVAEAVAAWGRLSGQEPDSVLRYAADVSVLCPMVALLGARRPQHAVWQFVVAALYAILLVPAVQGRWTTAMAPLVESPWSWFLLCLVVVGLFNGLPTRFWPATVVFGVAQLVILSPYLPGAQQLAGSLTATPRTLCGLGLLGLAVQLVRWRAALSAGTAKGEVVSPLDRLWLDFRDGFGALWGLRVQERVNAAAVLYGWPVVLAWDGFHDRASGHKVPHLPPAVAQSVEHSLRTLLRRFVSTTWIDRRLRPDVCP